MELGTLSTMLGTAKPATKPVDTLAPAASADDFTALLKANDDTRVDDTTSTVERDDSTPTDMRADEQEPQKEAEAFDSEASTPTAQAPVPQPIIPLALVAAVAAVDPATTTPADNSDLAAAVIATALPATAANAAAANKPLTANNLNNTDTVDNAASTGTTDGDDVIDALLAKFANANFETIAQNASPAATAALNPETPAVAEATPHPTAPKSLAMAGEPLNPNADTKQKALSAESLLQNDQPRQQRLTLGDSKAATQTPSDTPSVTDAAANNNLTPTPPAPAPQVNNNAAIAAKPLLVPAHAMTPVTEQVAVQIVKSAKLGTDKIRIQLSPEDLGRVEVKLELSKDSVVKAVVSADKPETAEWLARDAKQLERALADAGFKLDQSNLEFKQSNTGHNQHQAQQFGQDYRDQQSSGHKYYGDKNGLAELLPEHAATIHQYTVTTDGLNIMV